MLSINAKQITGWIFISDSKLLSKSKHLLLSCSTWNNLGSQIVNSYLSVRSWSHMATDYNRNHRIFSGNVITHKIPKETTANDNYLHSRRIESIRGRRDWSSILVCLGVSSFNVNDFYYYLEQSSGLFYLFVKCMLC